MNDTIRSLRKQTVLCWAMLGRRVYPARASNRSLVYGLYVTTLNRQSEDNVVDAFVCEIISWQLADMDCGSTSHASVIT